MAYVTSLGVTCRAVAFPIPDEIPNRTGRNYKVGGDHKDDIWPVQLRSGRVLRRLQHTFYI